MKQPGIVAGQTLSRQVVLETASSSILMWWSPGVSTDALASIPLMLLLQCHAAGPRGSRFNEVINTRRLHDAAAAYKVYSHPRSTDEKIRVWDTVFIREYFHIVLTFTENEIVSSPKGSCERFFDIKAFCKTL